MTLSRRTAVILLLVSSFYAQAENLKTAGQITNKECINSIASELPHMTEGANRKQVVIMQTASNGSRSEFLVQVTLSSGPTETHSVTTESFTLEGDSTIKICKIMNTEFLSTTQK